MKNPAIFLAEVRRELHKVRWPSKAQTLRYSLLVVAISVAVAIYLGILDALFGAILRRFL